MKGRSLFGVPVFARERSATPREYFTVKNEASADFAEIRLYDVIGEDWFGEGDSAKSFADALDKIPKGRKILVRINSPGGNVYDGIAMYKRLHERRADVTTQIDGIALSIASVIALGGSKVIIARTGQYMAHDPYTGFYVEGTEEDIAEAARLTQDALKAAKKSIVIAYMDRTGKTEESVRDMMKKTSWYVGQEAKDEGFVDEVSNEEALANSFNLSAFRNVPEAFRKLNNAAARGSRQSDNTMKETLVALLKEHGETVADSATDEQLSNQLKTVLAKAKEQPKAEGADIQAMNALLKQITDERDAEKLSRITREIDNAVGERRIVAAQRDKWIKRAVADESVLDDIKAMPQNLPPEGISVECVSESINDIANHALILGGHRRAPRNAVALTNFIRKNNERLVGIFNEGTNTIATELKQDVLLDAGLRAFAKIMMNLTAFSTTFSNVVLLGTAKVTVPFFDLQAAVSTDWNAANGYVAGDTAIDKRQVTIDKRKYQALSFTSEELRRQPYLGLAENMVLNAEKLAYDVQQNILSVITAANYATVAFTGAANTFDSNVLADLQLAANDAQWPVPGRSLFVNATYDNALKKDNALKLAFNAGGSEVIRQGKMFPVYGFDYNLAQNLPVNSENLTGFIAFKSALLIATAPIQPTDDVIRDGTQYTVASEPNGGPSLEMRKFGDSQKDKAIWVIESNYGFAKGNAAALQRIRSAA